MAKFVLILGGADLDKRSADAGLGKQMLERYMRWMGAVREKGQYVYSNKLHDKQGARIGLHGGKVVEGPFVEAKEQVGGLLVVDVATMDEAKAIARECPVLDMQNGWVEVRPVEEVMPPGR